MLRPYILAEYGGVYIDSDYHFRNSLAFLHKTMDLYTGSEGPAWPGLAAGIVGAKLGHPAILAWKYIILEYYGFRPNVWGTYKLIPMPAMRDEVSGTSGPRFFSFAVWAHMHQYGNNDVIFKLSVLNLNTDHKSYKFQRGTGMMRDNDPMHETIQIGNE